MSFTKYLRYLNPFGGLIGLSDMSMKRGIFDGTDNLGNVLNDLPNKAASYINSQTGGVTERDEAMMQYQTSEREAAQDWTAQREDTEIQRRMADMKAAGINPMMAASGNGASSSSSGASAPSSAPAASLSDIIQLATLKPTLAKLKADTDAVNTETEAKKVEIERTKEDTRSKKLANDFFEDTSELQKILLGDKHERNEWEKDVAERGADVKEAMVEVEKQKASAYTEYLKSQEDLIADQIKDGDLRRALMRANAREANANADYKAAMQSVEVKYIEAKTVESKEHYNLLKIEAKLKNGIYTDDVIKAMAKAAKQEALADACISACKRGDYSLASKEMQKMYKRLEQDNNTIGAILGLSPTSSQLNLIKAVLPTN